MCVRKREQERERERESERERERGERLLYFLRCSGLLILIKKEKVTSVNDGIKVTKAYTT